MKQCLSVLFLFMVALLFAEAEEQNRLIIGGDSFYPPYEFINAQGEADGYNVELSERICKMLGMEPEFRLAKWSLVRSWLENGDIDLVQGMSFSLERAKQYYFSGAHTVTWRSIFVRKDSSILSETDIMNASVVIQQDDVAEEYLLQAGFRGKMHKVPSQEIALKLLDKGDFDACVVNHLMALYTIRNQNLENVKALPQRIHQREYCYASLDPNLIARVDSALIVLTSSGELARLQQKWFASLTAETDLKHNLLTILAYLVIPLLCLTLFFLYKARQSKRRMLQLESQLTHTRQDLDECNGKLDSWHDNFAEGPVILYRVTHEPRQVLYISDSIEQWGYSAKQMYAAERDYSDIIFSEDRSEAFKHTDALQPGDSTILNYRTMTRDGDMRWILDFCRKVAETEDGTSVFWGYLIDITSQKKLEAQLMEGKERAEAANTAKSYFLANMSHEIRTPLNGITGFLQVLMQMDANPQQREIYDIMYSSSRNLLKIINDILDFSKIESGKLNLIVSDFNPRYLIADLIKQFEHTTHKAGLTLRAQIQEDIPDVLKGDQLRLRQILINLLQNAIKFSEHGQISVSAEVYTRSEKDLRILFRVSDTGIGIDPVKQADIFDNYSQADGHITSKYGGTGLGLAIVKRLVELMHGFIWVESEPGKGSCFFFIIPFETYQKLPEQVSELQHPDFFAEQKIAGSILLVEDEPINQMVTKRQLETWGLQVDLASNGADAVMMHQEKKYDLILMDIQMPQMDGITATQKIRDMEIAQNRHTPIVAYTAAALVGDRERFLAAGMDDYLAKPVEMHDLHRIIVKLLNQAQE